MLCPKIPPGLNTSITKSKRYAEMSRKIGSPYQKTLASTTPSSKPPIIAPGSDPIPPSIIAIKPLNVAHNPKNGVICESVDKIRKPAIPPRSETMKKDKKSVLERFIPMYKEAIGLSDKARIASPCLVW